MFRNDYAELELPDCEDADDGMRPFSAEWKAAVQVGNYFQSLTIETCSIIDD